MPLPRTAITLHGGCNCGAIRYRLDIPEYEKRILHPTVAEHRKSSPDAERFPFTCTCSCNDCRAATAGLFMGAICTPAAMVTVSCLSRNSEAAKRQDKTPFEGLTFAPDSYAKQREANGKLSERQRDGFDRPPYRPGMDMLVPSKASEDTFVGFYHSSAARTRSFCQRCGTPIAYNIWPMVAGLSDVIDIITGSLDREDLERIGEPDMHLWWDYGIDWVQKMISGCKAPKHPSWNVEETV